MPQRKSANFEDKLWLETFRRALTQRTKEPAGVGWLTKVQVQTKIKRGSCWVERFLREEAKAGRMERFVGSQVGKNGVLCPQIWYRPKMPVRAA